MNGEVFSRLKVISGAVGISITHMFAPKAALQFALDLDTTRTHGRCLGLSEERTEEVISTLLDLYRNGYDRPDWDAIRSRLTLCAMDLEWRP